MSPLWNKLCDVVLESYSCSWSYDFSLLIGHSSLPWSTACIVLCREFEGRFFLMVPTKVLFLCFDSSACVGRVSRSNACLSSTLPNCCPCALDFFVHVLQQKFVWHVYLWWLDKMIWFGFDVLTHQEQTCEKAPFRNIQQQCKWNNWEQRDHLLWLTGKSAWKIAQCLHSSP